LQRQHLPLAEIRKQLVPLDDTAVAAWVARRSAAAKYLDRVMESAAHAQEHGAYLVAESRSALQRPSMRKTFPRERAQWDRYSLADDVELHVRRPLSRDMNRRVERLLEAARKILNDDEDDTNGGAT
jgi:hypothetical protein